MTAPLFRRRRRSLITVGASGGTTFTNAIRFANTTDLASAASNAAYDDLATFTIALLARFDGTTGGTILSKHQPGGNLNGWSINTTADLNVDYVTTDGFKRAAWITADNSWQWFFLGLDRTNHLTTRAAGPQAGPIADIHRNVTDGGAGAFVTDAGKLFRLGSDSSFAGAKVWEARFVGIAGSILSLTDMQAIAADAVGSAGLLIDYWKPSATGGTGTSIPSGKSVLPPLVTTGATVV